MKACWAFFFLVDEVGLLVLPPPLALALALGVGLCVRTALSPLSIPTSDVHTSANTTSFGLSMAPLMLKVTAEPGATKASHSSKLPV
jgi:hypothetical protein